MKISPTREMHPQEEENLALEAGKTMFEIYRESRPPRRAHVIYYTELPEKLHKNEIEKAFAGDSVYSGFLRDTDKTEAKRLIHSMVERLNNDEELSEAAIEDELKPYLA